MTSELNAPRVVRTGIIRSRCAPDGISKETDSKPVNVLSSMPRVLRSLSNRKRIFLWKTITYVIYEQVKKVMDFQKG